MAQQIQFSIFFGATSALDLPNLPAKHFPGSRLRSLDLNNPQNQVMLIDYADVSLQLIAQVGRIDVIAFQPSGPEDALNAEIDPERVLPIISGTIANFAVALGAMRLAFVISYAFEASSYENAVAIVTSRADGFRPPANTTDVDVRINVPVDASEPVPRLNRNIRWQTTLQTMLYVGLPETQRRQIRQHLAILNIDVNTPPEAALLPTQLGPTLDAMIAAARALINGEWGAL